MKTTPTLVTMPPILLPREAAAAALGISTGLLEQLVAKRLLPQPRKISAGRTGWLRTELEAAAHALPVSDLAPGPGRRAGAEDHRPSAG